MSLIRDGGLATREMFNLNASLPWLLPPSVGRVRRLVKKLNHEPKNFGTSLHIQKIKEWQAVQDSAPPPYEQGGEMNREDIMTLVERYALAMRLVDRHGNQYGDRDLLTLTHQQIREGLKVLVVSEREACAKVCDVLAVHTEYASDITKVAAQAIRARGEK